MVALVTGASRGVGRGIALVLGSAGATVYFTGRTLEAGAAKLPGSLAETAAEIEARGGKPIPVACDHADDAQVRDLFERIRDEQEALDVLVNNVFAVPNERMHGVPFWEQPISMWDQMHRVGLRSHFVASQLAAPQMIQRKKGLMVHVSSWAGVSYQLNAAYGVGKAAVNRLAADLARELRPHGVASVALVPGIVRTERIVSDIENLPFDLSVSESPELSGRAVVALAEDPNVMSRTGRTLVVAELAAEYGFTDVDGTTPTSLRSLVEG